MTVSVAIMQLEVSKTLMQVTVPSNLSPTDTRFHKIDRKTFKGILSDLHFTNFLNILPRLRCFERRSYIYRSVERVIQHFSFLDTPVKDGDILDF